MASPVLQRLLQGSSLHCVKRDGWSVSLTPNGLRPAAIANFQHIVAMARRGEWQGYRIDHVLTDGGTMAISVKLDLIDEV
jgi:hypothetical protein